MDQLVRQPDRQEADRDQDDAEERIDSAHVRPRRAGLDRVTQHEVGAVEEEENEEEHELALAPEPPVPPRDLGPERAREQRQRSEDDALVDRDVALEVGARLSLPEVAKRLPRAPAEEGVRGQRDWHVDVEDPLREPLIGVRRYVEKNQRNRGRDQHPGERGEHRERIFLVCEPHGNACIFAERTKQRLRVVPGLMDSPHTFRRRARPARGRGSPTQMKA